MSADSIRVMLVDDQELIRTGFRLVLMAETGIEIVAEAGDGRRRFPNSRDCGPPGSRARSCSWMSACPE